MRFEIQDGVLKKSKKADSPAKPKQRNVFWQCVRGICILAVIMIHSPSGLEYGEGTFPYEATFILRQFINFPVVIFFYLAGYFTNPEKVRKDFRTYLLNRGGTY